MDRASVAPARPSFACCHRCGTSSPPNRPVPSCWPSAPPRPSSGRTRRGRIRTRTCGAPGRHLRFGGHAVVLDLRHWVNDGLMTVFFLVVGLEIKRELTDGHLSSRRAALLPGAAALGGMLLPP